MKLLEKQKLFVRCLGKLIIYANSKGWEFTQAEGYIGDSIDKPTEDTPHLRHGAHFNRLGIDLNLFINGDWIRDGSHLAWADLNVFWESLHPLCRTGYDFKKRDSNHFSIEHEGVM